MSVVLIFSTSYAIWLSIKDGLQPVQRLSADILNLDNRILS